MPTASYSATWTAPATGTYYWQASYPGDANNNPITTACGAADEVIAVGPGSPTIVTQASPATITVGTATSVVDTATFQNTTSVAPTGSVTFTLYSDNACTASTGVSGAGAISTTPPGVSTASFATGWVAPATGTYYWQATYAGDSNNNPFTDACAAANELIVVSPGSPAMTTIANPTSINAGTASTVGDTATFKETTSVAPTGSVTFTLYSDNSCTTSAGVSGSGPISTTAGVSTASFATTWTPSTFGTYYWRASYPGDSNNDGFTTGCGDTNETLTVLPAVAPPIIGTASASGFGGVSVTFTPDRHARAERPAAVHELHGDVRFVGGLSVGLRFGPREPDRGDRAPGRDAVLVLRDRDERRRHEWPVGHDRSDLPAVGERRRWGCHRGKGGCTVTPSAPLRPSAAAEAFPGAAVSWAPPISGCLAGYIVTPYLNGVAQIPTLRPGPGTTTVIRGLIPGDTYTFTIAAENGLVAGPASVMTPPVTIGVPGSPTALKVARTGKGSVRVSFRAPSGNGAPITSYTASCVSANGGKTRTKSARSGPLTVTGLTVGKSYNCAVTAINSRGSGRASPKSASIKA